MKFFGIGLILAAIALFACGQAQAHFGLVLPSRSMVLDQKQAELKFDLAFCHPFGQHGMAMDKPEAFIVFNDGKKSAIATEPAEYLGKPAFSASYRIARPGVYQFAAIPRPYFEQAENKHIIHYAKTIVGAFGYQDGFDEPIGLPIEIIPLSRPFGNYAGNVFCGVVLKDGKPLADADVEVEFLNSEGEYKAANNYLATQLVKTDKNGEFAFGIPWPGWWGFSALADEKKLIDGKEADFELGGVIWLEFVAPELAK